MKAILTNYRQAPRKVRLISTLITGKKVSEAEIILSHLIKRGALPMKKLLDSAVQNARVNNKIGDVQNLIVKATTDKGNVLKRWMPRAMGRAFPIHKHSSNVVITLSEKK